MHFGRRVSLTGLTAVTLVLGALILGSAAAGAHGAASVSSHAKSPLGSYEEHSSNGGVGQLNVLSNHHFSTNFQDSGSWVSLGTAVAFRVDASAEGDGGCVFLGTVTKKGINSAAKQGPQNCGTSRDTWYATRISGARAASVSGPAGPAVDAPGAVAARAQPVGTYTYTSLADQSTSILDINSNGTAALSTDTGYWVSMGTAIAFSAVSGPVDPCILVGKLNKTGINSSVKPGEHFCGAGLTLWYATK